MAKLMNSDFADMFLRTLQSEREEWKKIYPDQAMAAEIFTDAIGAVGRDDYAAAAGFLNTLPDDWNLAAQDRVSRLVRILNGFASRNSRN